MRLAIAIRHVARIGLLTLLGCAQSLSADQPVSEAHVVYNPTTGAIPLPNDVVRDASAGHLALPISTGISAAESEFREFMNSLDGWPSTTPLSAAVSAAVDPQTVNAGTVVLCEMTDSLHPLAEPVAHVDGDGTKLAITPPKTGWKRGATYVVIVRGGVNGVRTTDRKLVGPDQIFYFLRSPDRLDTEENNRAFPGQTREARLAVAKQLEAVRVTIAPYFDAIEKAPFSIPRDEVAALWSFTITRNAELAMDPTIGRMPLPFDGLIDPATKLVSLPLSPTDDPAIATIKRRLNRMNGFSLGPVLDFELTTAVDPSTATAENIEVYDVAKKAKVATSKIVVLPSEGATPCSGDGLVDACTHVNVTLADSSLPLEPKSTYAVVLKKGLKGRDGEDVNPMALAHFVQAENSLFDGNASLVSALTPELAERVEGVRREIAPLLEKIGRADVVAAWPFTTLDPMPRIREMVRKPEETALPAEPKLTKRTAITTGLLGAPGLSEIGAFDELFPDLDSVAKADVYVPRLRGVNAIVEGTIRGPNGIDAHTRKAREDGSWSPMDIPFVLTLPEVDDTSTKVPVVMFAHGMLTDRRFLLTIAGALAGRGFAAIAVDLPFHGHDTQCSKIPSLTPNFFPQSVRARDLLSLSNDMLYIPACPEGSSCRDGGRCVTESGGTAEFSMIPLSDVAVASGTAMMEFDPTGFVDRAEQAIVDLAAVRRSLATADWSTITGGIALETDRVYFAGQSLGATIGAPFVAATPDVERAVFNSPQADLLAMYRESTLFGPIARAVLDKLGLVDGSYQRELILNAARWIFDAVDPQSFAPGLVNRSVFLQMNKSDLVVPNPGTERLSRAARLRMKTYPADIHGALIVPGPGDAMLDDLSQSLAGAQIGAQVAE